MLIFICLMVLSYLIGCINTSIIYSLCTFKKDIRTQGSGNAGATNMLRSFGKVSAGITFLGDVLKAVIAIGITALIYRNAPMVDAIKVLSGFFCVLGHCFPVFFKFQGGKGIATGAGCILMMDWRVFLVAIGLFALAVLLLKYVSVGSLIGALTYPIGLWIVGEKIYVILIAALTTALVVWRHYKNILRLINKTESKITTKK